VENVTANFFLELARISNLTSCSSGSDNSCGGWLFLRARSEFLAEEHRRWEEFGSAEFDVFGELQEGGAGVAEEISGVVLSRVVAGGE